MYVSSRSFHRPSERNGCKLGVQIIWSGLVAAHWAQACRCRMQVWQMMVLIHTLCVRVWACVSLARAVWTADLQVPVRAVSLAASCPIVCMFKFNHEQPGSRKPPHLLHRPSHLRSIQQDSIMLADRAMGMVTPPTWAPTRPCTAGSSPEGRSHT